MNTNKYAYIDAQGYVQFVMTTATPGEIDGLTYQPIDFDLGDAPTEHSRFNFASRSWVDPRSQQEVIDAKKSEALARRVKLLVASDWTQIPNGPLTTEQQQAWATYRQALRDITQQEGYPLNIVWPTAPN